MISPQISILAVAAAAVGIIATTSRTRRTSRDGSYPPGPQPLPLVGCAPLIDSVRPWITYTKWKAVYGDIVYYTSLGQDVVVLNSEKVAEDLLEKRSSNYSDRMDMSIVMESYGVAFDSVFMRHNDKWRLHRRILQQGLRREPVRAYRSLQVQRTHELLQNLKHSPGAALQHFNTYSGSIILGVVYDHSVGLDKDQDAVLETVSEGNGTGIHVVTPGTVLLVTAFPFLRYIPKWMPGGWLNAAYCKVQLDDMVNVPFDELKTRIESGQAGECLGIDALERLKANGANIREDDVRQACGTAFSAGAETTSSALMIFLLAMVLHPEVQSRAQREIDAVVGTDRLPNFDDSLSLPYIEAIYRETLRWHPVLPLGIPHASEREDLYHDYHIPEASVVIPNVWAMTRDVNKYPDPEAFKPERFLDADGSVTDDECDFVFGFGRRVCPGRHLVKASLWVAIACILAELKIEKAKDSEGKTVEPNAEWICGMTVCPKPFPCSIITRSRQ